MRRCTVQTITVFIIIARVKSLDAILSKVDEWQGRGVEKFGVQSVVFVGTAPGYKYYIPKNVFIQIL